MMGDIDWFGTTFGVFPEGGIAEHGKRAALAMVRAGLAVTLVKTTSHKEPVCLYHLDARGKKAADTAAQDAGTAKRDGTHRCGVYCAITEEKQLGHKGVKALFEQGVNLSVSLARSTRRVLIVDVDTDAERKAFLEDWAANGGDVGLDTPLTVASPGVFRDKTWRHKDGGHMWFDVADDVELPATGEAKWCGCHKFDTPADGCKRKWSLFWTGSARYVLVPPSVRPEGPYRVTGQALAAPEWLIRIAQESATRTPAERTGELNNDDGDPINAWSSSTPWADLLTAAGWSEFDTDSCGCATWNRPGHANAKTATAHDPGCGQMTTDGGHGFLHLWTDAWRPAGKSNLTKLDFVAHVWHGGDYKAAMTALGIERSRRDEVPELDELFVLGESPGKGVAPVDSGARPDEEKGEKAALAGAIQEFWDRRPVLRNIHDLAWSEFAAPWATLGAVLGYVVSLTPPRVKVNDASLNLFVGLVGPPGSSKDAAIRAAKIWTGEYARADRLYQRSIGTGQGLEGALVKRVKDKDSGQYEIRQTRENIMVLVSEIDQITAHAKQQASTLIATLRSAWMGQMLGGMYKDEAKDLAVAEHMYRMCLLVGIQPGRAQALVQDHTGGLPQRFLWMPTTDPTFPDNPDEFRPEPWEWKPPVRCRDLADPFTLGEDAHEEPELEMGLCQQARDQIRVERIARLRLTHEGDELSTHDTLGRLKVAAALSLLDGRTDINEEDWELAGLVMQVSTYVRTKVIRGLEAEDRKRKEAEKLQRVEVEVAVEKAKVTTALDRAKVGVLKALTKAGGEWAARGDVRRSLNSSARGLFEDAAAVLIESGEVEAQEGPKGTRYRLKSSGA
jgi:hypothetical protein